MCHLVKSSSIISLFCQLSAAIGQGVAASRNFIILNASITIKTATILWYKLFECKKVMYRAV